MGLGVCLARAVHGRDGAEKIPLICLRGYTLLRKQKRLEPRLCS